MRIDKGKGEAADTTPLTQDIELVRPDDAFSEANDAEAEELEDDETDDEEDENSGLL